MPFFSKKEKKIYEDARVRTLFSEKKDEVVAAVNALVGKSAGSAGAVVEAELIDVVEKWEDDDDDSYAALWAAVVLGCRKSLRAVPTLLAALDSDADLLCEAAEEALIHIAAKHKDEILDALESFIEERLDNDPNDGRLYAYAPFETLAPDVRAKEFLVWAFREDDKWRAMLAGDLARWKDPRLVQLFRPALEFAIRTGQEFDEREFRDACLMAEGAYFVHEDGPELWEKPWEERWGWKLNELGKTDREIAKLDKERFKNFSSRAGSRADDYDREVKKEIARRDAYLIPDFNIEEWVRIRERNAIEQEFDEALRFLGFPDLVTVEAAQIWISRAKRPRDVLEDFLRHDFPSDEAEHAFLHRFEDLWNETPREEFQGLSPDEMIAVNTASR